MDKDRLRAAMALNRDTQQTLAEAMGIALSTLNAKINESDGREFTQSELSFIKSRYSLSDEEFNLIFFSNLVS